MFLTLTQWKLLKILFNFYGNVNQIMDFSSHDPVEDTPHATTVHDDGIFKVEQQLFIYLINI